MRPEGNSNDTIENRTHDPPRIAQCLNQLHHGAHFESIHFAITANDFTSGEILSLVFTRNKTHI